jgi:hypothetical protein
VEVRWIAFFVSTISASVAKTSADSTCSALREPFLKGLAQRLGLEPFEKSALAGWPMQSAQLLVYQWGRESLFGSPNNWRGSRSPERFNGSPR